MLQREEFRRRADASYRAGFAGCWPVVVLALVLLVACIAAEAGAAGAGGRRSAVTRNADV